MKNLDMFFERWARWPVIGLLLILAALIFGVWFPSVSMDTFSGPQGILDTQLWYGAEVVQAHMDALSPQVRNQMAWAHVTADMVFPLVYGLLLAFLLVKAWPQKRAWRLALAVVAADVMENILLAILYWTHPSYVALLGGVAGFWSALKWMLTALALFFIIRGAFDRWTERMVARVKKQ